MHKPDGTKTLKARVAGLAGTYCRPVREFVKRRGQPAVGSIAAALDIFRNEVRFYREIAPDAGIRDGNITVELAHLTITAADTGGILPLPGAHQRQADGRRAARHVDSLNLGPDKTRWRMEDHA